MITFDVFKRRANNVHNNFYTYDGNTYRNTYTKMRIICPIHGEFWQIPKDHLRGCGCKECSIKKRVAKRMSNTRDFIEKARTIHDEKYIYTKTVYKDSKTKVCIICPIHGEFWQTPNNHLRGEGCPSCTNNKKLTTEEFIKRAKEIHGDEFDYSNTEYHNAKEKVCIICKEHGEFWQIPDFHLRGCGCPKCNASHLENEMRRFLRENNLDFEEQKKFKWLGRQSLDFYLSQYNVAIECQGIQHFEQRIIFENIETTKERDKTKNELCKANGVKLLYYSNLGITYPYQVYENKEELLKEILKVYE